MKRVLLALSCVILAATSNQAADPTVKLAVAGRSNANVSLASAGSMVVAVWSASLSTGATDIYSAVSVDGGLQFGPPVRVNATAGEARVNAEQPPRVALRPQPGGRPPQIGVVWTTKVGTATRILSALSIDGGRLFRSAFVPGTNAPGNRGWEALAVGPRGQFIAVWLDHRRLAASQETSVAGQHQHNHDASKPMPPAAKTDGVAMAELSQLYVASLDASVSPIAITGGVCYCCKTAVAAAKDNLYLAWRHVYPNNMRDIAFSVSRDGAGTFAAPVRVSEDKWQIEGCPDDGPSMTVDPQGRVHIVWPSVVTERGGPVKALFHAVSTDGRTFSPRNRLPTQGQANHPQLAINSSGSLRVVWDESGTGTRLLASASGVADQNGSVRFTRESAAGELGVYPVVVPLPTGWLNAWTTGTPDASIVRLSRAGS